MHNFVFVFLQYITMSRQNKHMHNWKKNMQGNKNKIRKAKPNNIDFKEDCVQCNCRQTFDIQKAVPTKKRGTTQFFRRRNHCGRQQTSTPSPDGSKWNVNGEYQNIHIEVIQRNKECNKRRSKQRCDSKECKKSLLSNKLLQRALLPLDT